MHEHDPADPAPARVRYLAAQRAVVEGSETTLVRGVWALFGHGNIAAPGEAL